MSDIVISAENLGKKYIIGHQSTQEGYTEIVCLLKQAGAKE